jgi:hypothetical protein
MTQMGRSCKVIQKTGKTVLLHPNILSIALKWSRIELSSASMAAVNKYCVYEAEPIDDTHAPTSSCPAILDALRGDNGNMVSEIRTSDGS